MLLICLKKKMLWFVTCHIILCLVVFNLWPAKGIFSNTVSLSIYIIICVCVCVYSCNFLLNIFSIQSVLYQAGSCFLFRILYRKKIRFNIWPMPKMIFVIIQNKLTLLFSWSAQITSKIWLYLTYFSWSATYGIFISQYKMELFIVLLDNLLLIPFDFFYLCWLFYQIKFLEFILNIVTYMLSTRYFVISIVSPTTTVSNFSNNKKLVILRKF